MSDVKIPTIEAVFTNLKAMQYAFESGKGKKTPELQDLFRCVSNYLPVVSLRKGIFYRTRIIRDEDGEETGIIRKNGIPISGYNIQYSGVAPEKAVQDNGRANRKDEAVLYLAEDIETSCREMKAKETEYLSVAECSINNDIRVMDFSITTSSGLDVIFTEDIVCLFREKYDVNIYMLYIDIRNYFTSPNFKELEYAVTLDFLDMVKQRKDISGVKYNSFYTQKCNIALWDDNKYSKCVNSKVYRSLGFKS